MLNWEEGNNFCFELSRVSKKWGFEKSGFHSTMEIFLYDELKLHEVVPVLTLSEFVNWDKQTNSVSSLGDVNRGWYDLLLIKISYAFPRVQWEFRMLFKNMIGKDIENSHLKHHSAQCHYWSHSGLFPCNSHSLLYHNIPSTHKKITVHKSMEGSITPQQNNGEVL